MQIHILGDSLVQSNTVSGNEFFDGWGDNISAYVKPGVTCLNYALGGRSSRSFLNEGRFVDMGKFTAQDKPVGMGPVLPRIEKGDYVLMQFAHNDDDTGRVSYRVNKQVDLGEADASGIYPTVVPEESMIVSTDYWIPGYPDILKEDGLDEAGIETVMATAKELMDECKGTYYPYDCGATYKGYLKYYVDQIRAKGAVPIFVARAINHRFENGIPKPAPAKTGRKIAAHGYPYVEAMKQLGEELNVPVINLCDATQAMYEMLGEEDSSYLHGIAFAGATTAADGEAYRASKWPAEYDRRRAEHDFNNLDGTHSNRFGGFLQASMIIEQLLEKHILEDVLLKETNKKVELPAKLIPRKAEIAGWFNKIKIFKD